MRVVDVGIIDVGVVDAGVWWTRRGLEWCWIMMEVLFFVASLSNIGPLCADGCSRFGAGLRSHGCEWTLIKRLWVGTP